MDLSINIIFGGNCREAVTFYSEVFEQNPPAFITYGEGDTSFDPNVQMTEKGKSLIMNATMCIGDTTIVFNDMPDNFDFIRGNSFGVTLNIENTLMAQDIFDKLSSKGQIFVPFAMIGEQNYYGMLADQFDIMWTITSNKQ